MGRMLVLFVLLSSLSVVSAAQTRPLVLINGNGNISIQSTGIGSAGVVGGAVVGGSTHQATINKHDQTMEMTQEFLKSCPSIDLTLDSKATPDYIVQLNREGTTTIFGEFGKSQVMVLNAKRSPIFVSKKATVKNAVKSACNAVASDWQAHGRVQQPQPQPTLQQQQQPTDQQQPISASASQPPVEADVALVMRTTAKADKYCKPETIASVLSDTTSYLTAKGLKIGPAATAKTTLTLVVDRPITKWLEITVQGRDSAGNLLWSDKVADGGWGHLGTTGTLNSLEKVHKIIDTRLASNKLDRAAE
jgi:hypothetical protein